MRVLSVVGMLSTSSASLAVATHSYHRSNTESTLVKTHQKQLNFFLKRGPPQILLTISISISHPGCKHLLLTFSSVFKTSTIIYSP